MTIEIVNLWFSILEESNIENHDCEFLIFQFSIWNKNQMDENHTDQAGKHEILRQMLRKF